MKNVLIGLLILGSSLQLRADEIVVYHGSALSSDHGYFLEGNFDFDKELGRAWVVLDFSTTYPNDNGSQLRVNVPNMIFDQTTKEVVIENEAGSVVCAYEKRSILRVKNLKKTNFCKFKESFSTVIVNDGYNGRKVQNHTITLSY